MTQLGPDARPTREGLDARGEFGYLQRMRRNAFALRSMLGLMTCVVLGACGKKEPAAPAQPDSAAPAPDAAATPGPDAAPTPGPDAAPAPAPDAAAAPADCIAPETLAVLGGIDPDFARLDGRVVKLCGEMQEARHCVALDLDSGKRTAEKLPDGDVAHLPAYPAGFDDGVLKDETRPVLKLCASAEAGCKDLHVGEALAAHFDRQKARVVVTGLGEGKLTAHIYDAATLAETSRVEIGASDLPNCTFADFVGDSLLVSTGACSGGGKAWLADAKTGAKIADIGKSESAFVRDGQLAEVEGNTFVFRDASGNAAWVQDVASGEVLATIDLEKAGGNTRAKDDKAFVLVSGDDVILVESRPLVGTVFVAGRKDGAIKTSYVPRPCP